MHRVYNNKNKCWTKEDVYISTSGGMFSLKKSFMNRFGFYKLKPVSEHTHIVQNVIGVHDKNNKLIYEGDICRCEINDGKSVICVVGFAPECASYLFLDYKDSVFYPITKEVCDRIEIIGNIFDNPNLADELKESQDKEV